MKSFAARGSSQPITIFCRLPLAARRRLHSQQYVAACRCSPPLVILRRLPQSAVRSPSPKPPAARRSPSLQSLSYVARRGPQSQYFAARRSQQSKVRNVLLLAMHQATLKHTKSPGYRRTRSRPDTGANEIVRKKEHRKSSE